MPEQKKIITPEDPEFARALHDHAPDAFKKFKEATKDSTIDVEALKEMSADKDPVKVEFTIKDYPHFQLEYGIQELSEVWAKIAFHFKKITKQDMMILGEYLARCMIEMNPPDVEAEASENPTFRNHWDLIIYTTSFQAPFLRDRLLVFIDRYPKIRDV